MEFTIYLICLGVGFVFTLFSAIFGHVFGHGGHEGHVDGSGGHAEAGVDTSDMPGVSALSPTIISSFITAFGGFGGLLFQFSPTRPPPLRRPLPGFGGLCISPRGVWVLRRPV